MTTYPIEGGCQCGGVRYRITGEPVFLSVCGCEDCRKQTGSAFGMSLRVKKDDFELLSGELKTWSRSSVSGNPVDCAFCPDCGNRMWHAPHSVPDCIHIKPGTLDDPNAFVPRYASMTSNIPDWVELNGLEMSWETYAPLNARKGKE